MLRLKKIIRYIYEYNDDWQQRNSMLFSGGVDLETLKNHFIYNPTNFFSKKEAADLTHTQRTNIVNNQIQFGLEKHYLKFGVDEITKQERPDRITYTSQGERLHKNWIYFFQGYLEEWGTIRTILLAIILSNTFLGLSVYFWKQITKYL